MLRYSDRYFENRLRSGLPTDRRPATSYGEDSYPRIFGLGAGYRQCLETALFLRPERRPDGAPYLPGSRHSLADALTSRREATRLATRCGAGQSFLMGSSFLSRGGLFSF